MKRNVSHDYTEHTDGLLDDTSSSVNVELTREEATKLNEKLNNKQLLYGALLNNNIIKEDEEKEKEEDDNYIIKTLMDDYGNEYNKTQKTGTIFSSTLNLSNVVIGAGILGIPSAIRNSGYIMGILLFIIFGGVATYTMHLSMCVALCVEYSSYDALCRVTIPKLKKFADISVGFACFGVCVAYFVVIGDSMDLAMIEFLERSDQKIQIFGYDTYNIWINRYFWMILYLILFIIPTISLKKMDSLKFTSFFALFCFVILMIMVILYWSVESFDACHSLDTDYCHHGVTAFPKHWAQFFKTVPIFIFAYECHSNLWPIRNEIKVPTVKRLTRVSINTVIFCTTIYAVIGYAGYLTYGDNVDGNILNNYPQTRLVGIIRVGLAFAIAFSYPVVNYPARECFSTLFFGVDPTKLNWYTFYGGTYLMAILCIIVAIALDDLEIVLSLIGSIGGTSMVFILPGLFYYYLGDHPLLKQSSYHSFKRQSSVILIIVGVVLAIVGVVLQFTE
eukprot:299965_1